MKNTTSKVTIDGATTAVGFGTGNVSGNSLWNDKKNQTNIEVWVDDVQVWPIFVAQIGEEKYTTLQAAVDAAVDGDTIVLLADITEDVVVEQKPDVKITIDGDGKTLAGTITVNGKSAAYATAGLTIQNVNFAAETISKDAFINLGGSNAMRYTSNVTISNCTFTATPHNEGIVAIKQYTGGCKNLTVENCTATGLHSLIQLKNVENGLKITGCTVTDSKNGISIGNTVSAEISGCEINVNGYGIRADGSGANALTVSGCTIAAEMPIVVRNTTAAYELTVSGENELTAGNADGYQVIFTNGDDGTYEEPTGAFEYTADAELKVFPTYVAEIDGKGYMTLEAAFEAAVEGDEVKILVAGTYALSTSGKDITITGAVDGVVFDNIGAKGMGGANVTFNNVTFDYYPNVNYTGLQHAGNMVYNNCTINGQVFLYGANETFNGCTFNQNSADAYNVWTYGAGNVAFNDCTFNSVGKSVLVYNESANVQTNLSVSGSEFIASAPVEGKAAIEIDTSLMKNTTSKVTIDGATTAVGFGTGNVSGNSLWNDKKNQTNIEVWVDDVQVWPIFVAQIGEEKYTTFEAALEVAQNGEDKTIVLLKPVEITEDTTYDLSGVTVTSEGDAFIVTGGTLTLNGDGVVEAGTSGVGSWTAVWANGGNVVINGGTYSVGGDSTSSNTTHQNDVIYTKNGGTVTITGGTFLNDGSVWTLNQNDTTGGAITVTGGTFYGFNPADNVSEGANTNFVADGYIAVDNGDGSWSVVMDEKFYFQAAQVVAGNSLDMMFAFRQDELDDWTGHYVQITREFGDGSEPEVTTVPFEDWGTSGGVYYTVTYTNLAAKEMSDQITLVVCNAEGEEVSYPWIDSIRAYAMRMLEKATSDKTRTLFVDMLNYGAAAQVHFGYNTGDLANNQLSDEQKAYASTLKAMTSGLDQGDKHVGSNLITKSNIQFWVAFKGLTPDMYAVVEYTSHHPQVKSITIQGSEFGILNGVYYLNIDELVCADARQVVTITIYNADGSVYTTCQESLEDYLARQSSLSDVYQKAMQFFDSCYAYLH